jgi:hypothetical protein
MIAGRLSAAAHVFVGECLEDGEDREDWLRGLVDDEVVADAGDECSDKLPGNDDFARDSAVYIAILGRFADLWALGRTGIVVGGPAAAQEAVVGCLGVSDGPATLDSRRMLLSTGSTEDEASSPSAFRLRPSRGEILGGRQSSIDSWRGREGGK